MGPVRVVESRCVLTINRYLLLTDRVTRTQVLLSVLDDYSVCRSALVSNYFLQGLAFDYVLRAAYLIHLGSFIQEISLRVDTV